MLLRHYFKLLFSYFIQVYSLDILIWYYCGDYFRYFINVIVGKYFRSVTPNPAILTSQTSHSEWSHIPSKSHWERDQPGTRSHISRPLLPIPDLGMFYGSPGASPAPAPYPRLFLIPQPQGHCHIQVLVPHPRGCFMAAPEPFSTPTPYPGPNP